MYGPKSKTEHTLSGHSFRELSSESLECVYALGLNKLEAQNIEVLPTRETRSTFRHRPQPVWRPLPVWRQWTHSPRQGNWHPARAEAGADAPAAARSSRGLDPCLHPVCLRQRHFLLQQLDLSIT